MIESPVRPDASSSTPDEILCVCRGITRGQIQTAIDTGACTRLVDLTASLGAAAECGSCSAALLEMLGETSAWTPVVAVRRVLSADPGDEQRIEQVELIVPQGTDYPATHAGQHVTVQGLIAGRWVSRSYTVINPSPRPEVIRIAVRRVPEGQFTPWLLDDSAEPKTLRVSAPGGQDFWAESFETVVCLVGGIGVTMARSVLAQRAPGQRFHLDYSTRDRADQVFLEEHQTLARDDASFTLACRTDDVDGFITQAVVRDTAARFAGARFVLCGPPAYVRAVQGWLLKSGVADRQIHVEKFFLPEPRPVTRRSWKSYGYALGALLALLPALWLLPGLASMVPHHHHNPGHEQLNCADCHVNAPGTLRQQLQAKTDYWLGRSEVNSAFMFKPVDNRVCLDCHQRNDDHHPAHRFLEPRFAPVRETLGPQRCISCHREHQQQRLTVAEPGFCSACHKELKLKRDPATPTHAELIQANRWETCLGCHDFHNNHAWKPPSELTSAISPQRIREYFLTGPSPYGDVVEKARQQRSEPEPKSQEP